MFESARLKLTAWYLLIIMGISVVFSYAIYTQVNRELVQFESARQLRLSRMQAEFQLFGIPLRVADIDDGAETFIEARKRIIINLILINLGILVVSGGAGYFLAGRTLKPIQDMIDDQNQFITDASHELRTPLTSLKTTMEVNLREKHLTDVQMKNILQSNLEEVQVMQSLSDDLILLAQYQKPQDMIVDTLESKQIVLYGVSQVKALANVKSILLHTSGENILFQGDKKNIQTMVVIFLENAIKYSPKETTVTISVKKRDGKIQFQIRDEGIGIPKEDIPHIFDRFYRAEKARTRSSTSGYGLGLSIAKKIVDLHKGTIKVSSAINAGSVFTITLPIKQKEHKKTHIL